MRNKRINTAWRIPGQSGQMLFTTGYYSILVFQHQIPVTGRIDREIFVGEEKTLNDRQTP